MKKIILKLPDPKPLPIGAKSKARHAGAMRTKKDKARTRQALKRRLEREGW